MSQETDTCYQYLRGDYCRYGDKCHYQHPTNKTRQIQQWKKNRRGVTEECKQALLNTKIGSQHHVNFHCLICGSMLANANQIHRIYNNAVWVNVTDTIPDCFCMNVIQKYNVHKHEMHNQLRCKICNLFVGDYYPGKNMYKLFYVLQFKAHYQQLLYVNPVDKTVALNHALSQHSPLMKSEHQEGYDNLESVKPINKMFRTSKKHTEKKLAKIIGSSNPDELTPQLKLPEVRLFLQLEDELEKLSLNLSESADPPQETMFHMQNEQ